MNSAALAIEHFGRFTPNADSSQEGEKGVEGGERKLMAALLSDAVESYISFASTGVLRPNGSRPDVCEWVETRDFNYVFSFDVVCQCLGIDPEYLRYGLYRYVEAMKVERGKTWKRIRRPRKRD